MSFEPASKSYNIQTKSVQDTGTYSIILKGVLNDSFQSNASIVWTLNVFPIFNTAPYFVVELTP
jgi:hypothetical protein